MPEGGPLRRPAGPAAPRRPGRRCPRRAGTATARAAPGRPATIGGPSTRAARTGRRCCGTRRRRPWRPGRCRSLRCCRPRRTSSSVGSRIWVTWQSAQRARRGVTVTVSAPTPRTVRVRPVPNGRSTPRHRGQGMSPASRISSARSGHGTTITAHVSIHASQHCLSHPPEAEASWCCNGPTLTARRHDVADQTRCRQAPDDPGPTDRPTWVPRFVGAVVTPTNHHRAHPVSASPVTTAPAVIGTHDGVQQSGRSAWRRIGE